MKLNKSDSVQNTANLVLRDIQTFSFFYLRSLLQTFFCVCVRLTANTLCLIFTFLYLHTIYFSIYSFCKQFISILETAIGGSSKDAFYFTFSAPQS